MTLAIGDAISVPHRKTRVRARVIALKADKVRATYVYKSAQGRSVNFTVHTRWFPLADVTSSSGPAPDPQKEMRALVGIIASKERG